MSARFGDQNKVQSQSSHAFQAVTVSSQNSLGNTRGVDYEKSYRFSADTFLRNLDGKNRVSEDKSDALLRSSGKNISFLTFDYRHKLNLT